MSRIDEAMRRERAELETPGATPPATPDPAVEAEDPWHLAGEATPSSVGPARYLPSISSPAPGSLSSTFLDSQQASPQLYEKLVVDSSKLPSGVVEQYRRLAAALHHAQIDRGIRTVMITSGLAGEGKSLTATNLALTLADSYKRRVLLVDADLRRPSLNKVFQVPDTSGLSDGLESDEERRLPVIQVSSHLTLLPAGRPTPDPMALLTSKRMRHIVGEAREAFDWVLLDTPPIALLPDASLLAAMVDTAVLVVRAAVTPLAAAQRALESVGRNRVIGVVLNGVASTSGGQFDDYYGYGYGSYSSPRRSGG